MKWASALSQPENSADTLARMTAAACRNIVSQIGQSEADLVIAFISPHFRGEFAKLSSYIKEHITTQNLLGCTARGLIGGGQEIEHEPAIALLAAILPDVEITTLHIDDEALPDLDDPQSKWEELIGLPASREPHFILLPDPFSFRIDVLVQGLDFAYPQSKKLGGLASGASQPGQNALFLNDQVFSSGLVTAVMSGNLHIDSIVAQGCRPIGRPVCVTKCDRNLIYELEGRPAVEVLQEILESVTNAEQKLAKNSLFIGVVMNEFKESFGQGDFLIRNILGLEPVSGALLVGEMMRVNRTVQFHVRDAETSSDDLRNLLHSYTTGNRHNATGAVMFSCLGRGQHLYGIANHDSNCFQEYVGKIPIGGFFCNGEIGPVGSTTFLHGYTSSFGIFSPKEKAQ